MEQPKEKQSEQIRSAIFSNPQEQLLCVAGSPQLKDHLNKKKKTRGFAVLSDEAIYCNGSCYLSRDRRKFRKQNTDFRISLELFQGLKYLRRRNSVFLILGFLFLLMGPAVLLVDKLTNFGESSVLNPTLDAILLVLLAGVCFLLGMIHKKNLLELIHVNGSVGIDTQYLPPKEERLFIRYLRAYLSSAQETE